MSDYAIGESTVSLPLGATSGVHAEMRLGFSLLALSGAGSLPAERVPRDMPASIPADQAYYWSMDWQDDIRESIAALDAGEYEDFDSDDPNDVVRWFLSDDD